jgi:hypothetical protein
MRSFLVSVSLARAKQRRSAVLLAALLAASGVVTAPALAQQPASAMCGGVPVRTWVTALRPTQPLDQTAGYNLIAGYCETYQAASNTWLPALATDTLNVKANGAACDGSTKDTAAIQATINLAAGRARVYVPRGVTCMVGTLALPSSTDLAIDGTLQLLPRTNGDLLVANNNATNITVEGSGTLNGNASAQTGGFSGGFGNLGTLTYFWWRGLTSTNFQNSPFGPTNATHAWVSNAVFSNSGNSVGFSEASSDCWADNIHISDIADEGYAFYGGVSNCGIANSIISGVVGAGISVLNDSGQTAANSNIVISNNILTGNGFSGVDVDTGAGATAQHSGIVIAGNRISGNNTGNHAGSGGIKLNNVANVTISANNISKDGTGSNGAIGVNLSSASVTGVSAAGNIIYDEGQGNTLGVGISDASATNVLLADNLIYDDQGTQTMAFGINGTAGAKTQVLNNSLGPVIGASNNLTPIADTVVVSASNSGQSYTIAALAIITGGLDVAGSANNMSLTAATTGNAPAMTAYGSDASIWITAAPKGAGFFSIATGGLHLPVYTVATLPTCLGTSAHMAAVSDATSPTYGGSLTGGGSAQIPVFCNGTIWSAH